jgi:murein DD-endopeptidase MepM/ murein hydrolase activator NlpD
MANNNALLMVAALLLLSKKSSGKSAEFKDYEIRDGFGDRKNPLTGKDEFHTGIDLAIPENTRLKAISDAIVISVDKTPKGGNQLRIKLKNGLTLGFAHLNRIYVKKNQSIKKGDIIALTGKTGQVTGAHLHLTVRDRNGKLVDPAKYFKAL